ncbi:hypothetical protein BJ138DRAFT_1157635 [Hygrophoropsis aurantiaca]|uniref:Uncharacterized protein n=1 Tax=Hygrophoropsis aurantiaca TaxID=72124 RepID=A0ACB8A534_9AGAM|nr:hypothetical protein BJ138DRAFT_1157635 [Hygrophoropsis aurantiaca]
MLGVVCQGLTGFIAQSFFTWRIWKLSSARMRGIIPIMIMPFVIVQPVLCITFVAQALENNNGVSSVEGTSVMQYIEAFCGTAAGVDIAIALVMCTLLYMGRSGFNKHTDRMLLRLMFISVNTGLWTALLSIVVIALLVGLPSSNREYIAGCFPLATLYCNSVLANLNARSYVRSIPSEYLSTLHTASRFNPSLVNVSVETETTQYDDYESMGHDSPKDATDELKS